MSVHTDWVSEKSLLDAQVVIIDDDEQTLYFFETILRNAGISTRSATDSRSAIKALDSSSPEVILLDLGLPGGSNGSDIIDYVRRTAHLKHSRIIVISAYTDLADHVDRSHVSEVHIKPVSGRNLLKIVQNRL